MAIKSIKPREWVVVCDGGKALVLENIGDTAHANLKTREAHEHRDLPTRAQGTDAPGRTTGSVGNMRSAMDQTDWHERAEQAFLQDLAKRLDVAVTSGAAKSLIIAAPPRALGILRAAYTPALREAVRAEVDKDLVGMPIGEIEKRLMAA